MFLPLYIDPGTGSMLFSLFIGIAAAASFGLRALFVKLRFILSGGKSKTEDGEADTIPFVIFSDHKRYWNVFKPVCDEFEKRGTDIVYYTASPDDPVLTAGYTHIHPEFIGSGNKPYAKLNFLKADIVLSTTPGLDVYQWKRSKGVKHYVHLLHSIDNMSTYRMFSFDYYDAILISGSHQEEFTRFLESQRNIKPKEMVYVGMTYFDYLLDKKKQYPETVKNEQPVVLVAPSWGKSSLLNKYGKQFIDKLLTTGYQIVIRPHPQSQTAEKELLESLKEAYKDEPKVSWNFDNDNFDILNKSDILISDFSGVMYDYAFIFNKPFIYTDTQFDTLPYDADWSTEENWNLVTLPRLGVKLEEKDFDNIKEVIDSTITSTELSSERQKVKDEIWQHPGEAGKLVADYLLKKRDQLLLPSSQPDGK